MLTKFHKNRFGNSLTDINRWGTLNIRKKIRVNIIREDIIYKTITFHIKIYNIGSSKLFGTFVNVVRYFFGYWDVPNTFFIKAIICCGFEICRVSPLFSILITQFYLLFTIFTSKFTVKKVN